MGGVICTVGQGLFDLYGKIPEIDGENVPIYVSVTLVFLSAFLTGIGVYDKIAKFGGAGTLVPITGFANAMVSPAMEFKTEGFILGLGVKMFIIAGPVLVYGTVASFIYGILYYVITKTA